MAEAFEAVDLPSKAAWRDWLAANHAASPGVWLRIAKKNAAAVSVTYAEAVEVALCYGWIDGQKRAGDDASWLQRFTPRGPRSRWSQRNREAAEALLAAGVMAPAGRAAVEAARTDGRWEAAYAPPSRATVPDDLRTALDDDPVAAEFFATLDGRNRYSILHRIESAKRAETRAARIARFVAMLAAGEKLYP